MIKEANETNTIALATMLKDMMDEVFVGKSASCLSVYVTYIEEALNSSTKWLFIDTDNRGFFMVVNDTETITPLLHRYFATKVYIKPEHRKSRLLAEFYDTLYDRFDEVVGVTEIGSEHIAVLEKRQERIANVYRIKRR